MKKLTLKELEQIKGGTEAQNENYDENYRYKKDKKIDIPGNDLEE